MNDEELAGRSGEVVGLLEKRDGDALFVGTQAQVRRLAPAARGGIPVETRIPASERTSQKLSELLTQGVAEGDGQESFAPPRTLRDSNPCVW